MPEITDAYSMIGRFDDLLRVVTQSVESYERLLKKSLLHLPGVGDLSSSFALNEVKRSSKLPIQDRAADGTAARAVGSHPSRVGRREIERWPRAR